MCQFRLSVLLVVGNPPGIGDLPRVGRQNAVVKVLDCTSGPGLQFIAGTSLKKLRAEVTAQDFLTQIRQSDLVVLDKVWALDSSVTTSILVKVAFVTIGLGLPALGREHWKGSVPSKSTARIHFRNAVSESKEHLVLKPGMMKHKNLAEIMQLVCASPGSKWKVTTADTTGPGLTVLKDTNDLRIFLIRVRRVQGKRGLAGALFGQGIQPKS